MKNVAVFFLVFSVVVGVYSFSDYEAADISHRTPASVPQGYEELPGCQKQDVLWDRITSSAYEGELPAYRKLGLPQLISMSRQEIGLKGNRHSDFSPEKWVKYLHRRGSIAKVKIVPVSRKYTGIFEGAECALLRLSLTYKVSGGKPVAPGLALKVLRDGIPSANVSALVSLNGQGKDHNFFKLPMSNIVPAGSGIGQKLVHKLFRKVTRYPEELLVEHMASERASGARVKTIVSPRQLFFVPAAKLEFPSEKHDVREDFARIPAGTKIYELRALPEQYRTFDYDEYTPERAESFAAESEHVADIVTTSEFVSSAFGDDGIFFRHELR